MYVSASGIPFAGEGLFAKRDLEEGDLAAVFNGVRLRDSPGVGTDGGSAGGGGARGNGGGGGADGGPPPFSAYKIGLNSEV